MAATKPSKISELYHADSDFKNVVIIPGYADIILDTSPGIYSECNSYDSNLYSNLEEYWHQIMVFHNGLYKTNEILRQLGNYFPSSMFNPVAYRNGRHVSQFLIRLNKLQVNILFSNHLKLLMEDGKFILLNIKINVARAHFTHIDPLSKIKSVVKRQLGRCENIGELKVLNLNNFHAKNTDMFITMANLPTFEIICKCLAENLDLIVQKVRGLKLLNNRIKSLKPLAVLQRMNIEYLDLSSNEIAGVQELYHLQPFRLSILKIFGNPHLNIDKIKEILPNIKSITIRQQKAEETCTKITEIPPPGDRFDTGNFNVANYMKSDKWHQVFLLHNGCCKKKKLLEAIFDLCEDTEFYPCYYKEGVESDCFFIRNCPDTINAIKNADLKLNVDDTLVTIRLLMNTKDYDSSDIDPIDEIAAEINRRYNLIDKSLDLAAFIVRSTNNLIINIANPKILTRLLILTNRKFGSSIQHMNLEQNDIKSAKGLYPLINMKTLMGLNLSNNNINDYDELFTLIVNLKLTDLRLANNPFCKNLEGVVYVKELKKKLSTLETLDGYTINENVLTFNKNYLCHLDYYDFVQKFIKNYFQIFDSQLRFQITDFYHANAIYSMSMNYNSKISATHTARINKYSAMSRNILKCSDFRQYSANLLIGNKVIASYFTNLPITEHDYNSFSIDVTFADENMICITLNGVLKELGSTLLENELWVGFTRTFLLKSQNKQAGFLKGGIDYTICNEHMHVFSLNILQTKNVFKTTGGTSSEATAESSLDEILREIDVKYENECLTKIFMEVTKMKMNWSVRCLSRMDRQLVPAIEYFLRLERLNKIPKIAYNHK